MEQKSSEDSLLERGLLRLCMMICEEKLVAFVYEGSRLKHPKLNAGPCSIFVKFSLIQEDDSSIIHQTKEVVNNVSPMFYEVFTYKILPGDLKKRLWITVWCKDSSNETFQGPTDESDRIQVAEYKGVEQLSRQTDLIGSMSFGMEHLQEKTQKKTVEGWFCLLLESVGRRKHMRPVMSNAFKNLQLDSFMKRVTIVMLKESTGCGFTLKGSSVACVVKVKRDSSAAMAGLASGDCIESVNGQNVSGLSAESVAAIIASLDKLLVLDISRYPAFEQDENMETSDSYRDPRRPDQVPGIICTRFSQRDALLWNQERKKTCSQYVDAYLRRINRRRFAVRRALRSEVVSTVEYEVEEAEIGESLPMAPPL